MKSSFNAFGRSRKEYGSTNIPVWLGTVTPIPRGGVLKKEYIVPGQLIPAGTPVSIDDNNQIVPLATYTVIEVVSSTAFILRPSFILAPNDPSLLKDSGFLIENLESFSDAASPESTNQMVNVEKYGERDYKIRTMTEVGFTVGDEFAFINRDKIAPIGANAYLYNDICLGDIDTSEEEKEAGIASATGAVVMFHAEGILIDRTPAAPFAQAMAKAVPHVLQVKG